MTGFENRSNFQDWPDSGYCLGTFVGGSLASSAEDCQAACQQQADCQWFNFHTTDNACSFVSDCAFLDETCGDTCWHGSKFCNATEDGSDECNEALGQLLS